MKRRSDDSNWTLLTNHGRILLLLAKDPEVLVRDLAAEAGVTERRAQAILADLEDAKYIKRVREGRRNVYSINLKSPFRHPSEAGHSVGELIKVFRD
ncbi:MAG: ArsR family transcriptional regulator [Actinobacteria bacterium]|jgi:DNA-binding MarR family transcriptional regulator|nr:ArsR family transcriptional regulator [Actinomycetota bacterium]